MGITRNSSWSATAIACLVLVCCVDGGISKITYKKPMLAKEKEKYQKQKVDLVKLTTGSVETDLNKILSNATTESVVTGNVESTTGITLTLNSKEQKFPLDQDFRSTTAMSNDISPAATFTSTTTPSSATTTESLNIETNNSTTGDDSSTEPLPCTCGIFLSSQFTKGSQEPPQGDAVISNSLGRTFPCNAIGQKQCQTKCLEQIVQHLPNSANILCASLDRDIRKERAYLFIKNCENQWINTNLAAGREYCCKNRESYNCK